MSGRGGGSVRSPRVCSLAACVPSSVQQRTNASHPASAAAFSLHNVGGAGRRAGGGRFSSVFGSPAAR